jgi:hypothetical protein
MIRRLLIGRDPIGGAVSVNSSSSSSTGVTGVGMGNGVGKADLGFVWVEYRSALFYSTPEQKEIAEKVTAEVQDKQYVMVLSLPLFLIYHMPTPALTRSIHCVTLRS